MNEVNINEVIGNLVLQFSQSIIEKSKALGNEAMQKLKVNLNISFSKYLERSHEKYSKTKTLLYREKPVPLKDFYVRTDLTLKNTKVSEEKIIDEINKKKRLVISGIAGSGKSTFCKSIFIEIIEKQLELIPIFVELRHLNQEKEITILDYITEQLAEIEPTFTKKQLEYALDLGKIILILDGFDEINNEIRDGYEKNIQLIAGKYSNIKIVLSSRPDNRFSSWDEFYTYYMTPLDKKKARKLIEKLEYDESVKNKFLSELDSTLYKKHKSFAENPLLLTMMLLTYEQIAEIPTKIHLFYEQAFLTLFNKHDSLKSLYKRKSFSELPLDEFKKLLSWFSILTYSDRKYYFTDSEINYYAAQSISMCNVKTTPEHFIKDLLDSICLIQRDGLGYTFTHRSFQEYFTAIFLITFPNKQKYEIFEKIAFTNDLDDVIPMSLDMNQNLVEQEWIIPRIEKTIAFFPEKFDSEKEKLTCLSKMFASLMTHESDAEDGTIRKVISFCFHNEIDKNRNVYFMHFIRRLYPKECNNFFEKIKPDDEKTKRHERDLIRIDLKNSNNFEMSIENFETLKQSTRSRIIKSGCCNFAINKINSLKNLLSLLKERHEKNENNILSLLTEKPLQHTDQDQHST